MLFLTVSVENLMGYGHIVCEFALCNFNVSDQPTNGEGVRKKQESLKTICIYLFTLCSRRKTKYVNAVKTSLFTLVFKLLILK